MADLTALEQYLVTMGTTVALAPTDPRLPAELTTFLVAMPVNTLTITPGAGGIALAGQVLTVSGAVSAATAVWQISGLPTAGPYQVEVSEISITLTDSAGNGGPVTTTVAGTARGALLAFGRPVAVVLESSREPFADGGTVPAWRLGLAADTTLPVEELLALGLGGSGALDLLPSQPPVFQDAAVLAAADFALTFYPGTQYVPLLVFSLSVPAAQWTVIESVLEFTGVSVTAVLSPSSYQITLIGEVTVGTVQAEVGIGLQPGSRWTAFLRPASGTAFPGLAALAAWAGGAGGTALASAATGGLAALPLGTSGLDAAISSVRIAFDTGTWSLLSVDIGSVLTFGGLSVTSPCGCRT